MRKDIQVEGPRPADDVWDRYRRPARWPEWSPQIRSVEYGSEFFTVGSSGVVRGPAGLRVRFRIVDVDEKGPVRQWSWTATAVGVELFLSHTVEALGNNTRCGLTIEGPAPIVTAYAPLATLALHRLVH